MWRLRGGGGGRVFRERPHTASDRSSGFCKSRSGLRLGLEGLGSEVEIKNIATQLHKSLLVKKPVSLNESSMGLIVMYQ